MPPDDAIGPTGAPTVRLMMPAPVLCILPGAVAGARDAIAHWHGLTELFQGAWPQFARPPTQAATGEEVQRALEREAPRILYYFGPAEVRDGHCWLGLAAGEGRDPGEPAPLELATLADWIPSRPRWSCSSTWSATPPWGPAPTPRRWRPGSPSWPSRPRRTTIPSTPEPPACAGWARCSRARPRPTRSGPSTATPSPTPSPGPITGTGTPSSARGPWRSVWQSCCWTGGRNASGSPICWTTWSAIDPCGSVTCWPTAVPATGRRPFPSRCSSTWGAARASRPMCFIRISGCL
jgi:hypothetical protein